MFTLGDRVKVTQVKDKIYNGRLFEDSKSYGEYVGRFGTIVEIYTNPNYVPITVEFGYDDEFSFYPDELELVDRDNV